MCHWSRNICKYCKIVAFASTFLLSLAVEAGQFINDFEIKVSPGKETWKYFFQMPDADRELLWRQKANQGAKLIDWSWEWRLGWVRACSSSQRKYCQEVLTSALVDKALVVRAEAVRLIGIRYHGTADPEALLTLENMYHDPRNSRRGRPLFIQYYILKAIKEVGGDQANGLANTLAAAHEKTAAYWKKL